MRSLNESAAILTVHEGVAGQYILRVSDTKHRSLLVEVSKILPDAQQLVVITPADIRVFNVNGNESHTETVPEEEVDAETQRAIDEQEKLPLPGQAEVVGETQQGTKVVRRRGRPRSEVAGHDEPCGRCSGTGQIQAIMEGGAPTETPCPVCQGKGIMRRYGAKR